MEMMMENFCAYCDEVVHTVCDPILFEEHKVGKIKCPKCGKYIMPCNEAHAYCCNEDCDNCCYRKSQALKVMTDEEYLMWISKNEPQNLKYYKEEYMCNDYWDCIAHKIGITLD